MGKADRYSASAWFIFSVFSAFASYRLGMGSLHQPGPGFIFFWIALIVAMLSLAVVIQTFVGKASAAEEGGRVFETKGIKKVVLVLAALLLYALLFEYAGFVIVTFLLIVYLLKAIEKKSWSFSLLVGAAVTAGAYLVFETALQSQLPKGLLERLGL